MAYEVQVQYGETCRLPVHKQIYRMAVRVPYVNRNGNAKQPKVYITVDVASEVEAAKVFEALGLYDELSGNRFQLIAKRNNPDEIDWD